MRQIGIFGAGWLGSALVAAFIYKYKLSVGISSRKLLANKAAARNGQAADSKSSVGNINISEFLKKFDESYNELLQNNYFKNSISFSNGLTSLNTSLSGNLLNKKPIIKPVTKPINKAASNARALINCINKNNAKFKLNVTNINNYNPENISFHSMCALPHKLQATKKDVSSFFGKNLKILILCFPPSGIYSEIKKNSSLKASSNLQYNMQYAKALVKIIEPIVNRSDVKVIFTSSTSVYNAPNGEGSVVTEKDGGTGSTLGGMRVWQAEEALRSALGSRLVCLRLGGLIGGLRHPCIFVKKNNGVFPGSGSAPVNLVHKVDVVLAIEKIVDAWLMSSESGANKTAPRRAYNVVANTHPTRETFYGMAAQKNGMPPPTFSGQPNKRNQVSNSSNAGLSKTPIKIVDSSLLRKHYAYAPLFDNLINWLKNSKTP